MNVQETKRRVRLLEWAEQINECRQSGLTVRKWCDKNGVFIKTYYNRMKRVREELLDSIEAGNTNSFVGLPGLAMKRQPRQIENTVFAALPASPGNVSAVKVYIGDHIAEITNCADAETIDNVLRTLARL
jgi:hypothetical protein